MANTMTTANLQAAKAMIGNGTPAEISAFYNYMYQNGYGYASLANGVVNCSSLSGTIAQKYMMQSAAEQGVNLTATQITGIEKNLANRYIDTLINNSENNSGSINTEVSFEQAKTFHTAVFAEYSLGPQTWTLYTPSQILPAATMIMNWAMITGSNGTTGNLSLVQGMATCASSCTTQEARSSAATWLKDVIFGALNNTSPVCPAGILPFLIMQNGSGTGVPDIPGLTLDPIGNLNILLGQGVNVNDLANTLTEAIIPASSTMVASSDGTGTAEALANATARQTMYNQWASYLQGLQTSSSVSTASFTNASGTTTNTYNSAGQLTQAITTDSQGNSTTTRDLNGDGLVDQQAVYDSNQNITDVLNYAYGVPTVSGHIYGSADWFMLDQQSQLASQLFLTNSLLAAATTPSASGTSLLDMIGMGSANIDSVVFQKADQNFAASGGNIAVVPAISSDAALSAYLTAKTSDGSVTFGQAVSRIWSSITDIQADPTTLALEDAPLAVRMAQQNPSTLNVLIALQKLVIAGDYLSTEFKDTTATLLNTDRNGVDKLVINGGAALTSIIAAYQNPTPTSIAAAAMQLLQAGIPFTDELKRATSDALGFGRVDMTQINELLAYGGAGLAVVSVMNNPTPQNIVMASQQTISAIQTITSDSTKYANLSQQLQGINFALNLLDFAKNPNPNTALSATLAIGTKIPAIAAMIPEIAAAITIAEIVLPGPTQSVINGVYDAANGILHGIGSVVRGVSNIISSIGSFFGDLFGPLVVNLTGGNVHTTTVSATSPTFDIQGTGTKINTGWITPDEGFLVRDLNGDGQINSVREMFSEINSTTGQSAFGTLASLDANQDGRIDANDRAWNDLKIWVDKNGDGVSQANELYTLGQLGIASIDLNIQHTYSYNNGNVIGDTSTFTYTDGSKGQIADALLAAQTPGATNPGSQILMSDNANVVRLSNGETAEILKRSGQDINISDSGINVVVSQGGNKVSAGNASGVVLIGANRDVLDASNGANNTVQLNGDGGRVNAGGSNDTVTVAGSGNVATIAGTGSHFTVSGNGNLVAANGASEVGQISGWNNTLVVSDPSLAYQVNGQNDIVITGTAISLADGAQSTINNVGQAVILGNNSTLTVNGGGNSVIAVGSGNNVNAWGDGNHLSVSGDGNAVSAGGVGDVIWMGGQRNTLATANSNVRLADGSQTTFNGSSDAVSLGNNSQLQFDGINSMLTANGTNSAITANGLNNSLVLNGSGNNLVVNGQSNVLTVHGSGNSATANGTSNVLDLGGNGNTATVNGGSGSVTVSGSGDTLTVNGDGAMLTISGIANDVSANGAGDTIALGGQYNILHVAGNNVTVTDGTQGAVIGGSYDAVSVGSNSQLEVGGNDISLTANGGNSALISNGTNNSVTLNGGGNTAVVNGLANSVVVHGSGNSATANGVGNTLELGGSWNSATINGGGNNATVDGTGGSLTVNGNGETLTLQGSDNFVAANGIGDSITMGGQGNTLHTAGNSILITDGSHGDVINGIDNAISVGSASQLEFDGANTTLTTTGGNSSVVSNGVENSILLDGAWNGLILSGQNNSVSVHGFENTATANGIGNIIEMGGSGSNVTVNGGGNTVMVDGAGGSLTVNGNGETLSVFGSGNIVVANGAGDAITFGGQSNNLHTAGNNITVAYGAQGGVIGGIYNSVEVGSDSQLEIAGTNMSLTANGANSNLVSNGIENTLVLNGSGNMLTANGQTNWVSLLGSGGSATVNGIGNSIELAGSGNSVTINGGDNAVSVDGANGRLTANGNGETLTIHGSGNEAFANGAGDSILIGGWNNVLHTAGNSVTVEDGALAIVNGVFDTMMLHSWSQLTLNGERNKVVIGGTNDMVTVNGRYDVITASGTGHVLNMGNSTLNLLQGAQSTLNGSGDIVNMDIGGLLFENGSDNWVNAKAGDQIYMNGNGNGVGFETGGGQVSVNGTGDLVLMDNGTLTLSAGSQSELDGGGNTIYGGAGSSLVIAGMANSISMSSGNIRLANADVNGINVAASNLHQGAFAINGIAYTSSYNGDFASAEAAASMQSLANTGANSVEVTVSQYLDSVSSVNIHATSATESDANIQQAIADAQAKGLQVMLKPHVIVADGTWSAYLSPADVSQFFSNYKNFIVHYAQIAETNNVSMLSIGVEMASLTGSAYASQWSDIISAVRNVYHGQLTYAATFGEVGQVNFWNQLDVIGVNPYLSLTNQANPTLEQLIAGWTTVPGDSNQAALQNNMSAVDFLHSLATTYSKPVVFTEVGYRSINATNIIAGDWSVSSPVNFIQQFDAYRAFFQTWGAAANQGDWLKGAYLWQWVSNPSQVTPDDFSPQQKAAMSVLTDWYHRTAGQSVQAASQASVGGNSNTIVVGNGDTLNLSGNSNSVNVGANAVIDIAGQNNVVSINDTNDILHTSGANQIILGGSNASTIVIGDGNTIDVRGSGDTAAVCGINNNLTVSCQGTATLALSSAANDTLQFENGIAIDQLWFAKLGNDLIVSTVGGNRQIDMKDWYSGTTFQVAQFHTADGHTLSASQVDNLVQAMASFAPPPSGQTTLPQNYQTVLSPVIAANWQ